MEKLKKMLYTLGIILIVLLIFTGWYSSFKRYGKENEKRLKREEIRFKRDSLELKLLEKKLQE